MIYIEIRNDAVGGYGWTARRVNEHTGPETQWEPIDADDDDDETDVAVDAQIRLGEDLSVALVSEAGEILEWVAGEQAARAKGGKRAARSLGKAGRVSRAKAGAAARWGKTMADLRADARDASAAIYSAVVVAYPELWGFLLSPPTQRKGLVHYADEAWMYAASRISQAYGIGRGSEWLAQHHPTPEVTPETAAAEQALASLRGVSR